jgi:predicted TIM-barrel fold metal-dependent hydrolase
MTAAAPVPFVDTHVHFWDLAHPTLTYGWLAPGVVHPILGDIEAMKSPRYDAQSLLAESRFADVQAFVHVQAAVGTPDPVEETAWLNDMADAVGEPSAIVAHADLSSGDLAVTLDRHVACGRLRGVRDFALEPALASGETTSFETGLLELASRMLVVDLDCEWPNMAEAARLASRHQGVTFALEHLGYPRNRDPEYFEGWKTGITALAASDNVYCKISGLGMGDHSWKTESIRPWVLHCIESFGTARCVFGTNWPVDRLYSSYDAVVSAYRETVADLTLDEQHDVLHRNAEALYRLNDAS